MMKFQQVSMGMEEENPIKKIMAIMRESKITALEAKKLKDTANGNIKKIKEKYDLAQKAVKIDSMVGWMLKAIKDDHQVSKSKTKTGTFNDYEQRDYNLDDLEKKCMYPPLVVVCPLESTDIRRFRRAENKVKTIVLNNNCSCSLFIFEILIKIGDKNSFI